MPDPVGILGVWSDAEPWLAAATSARDAGYTLEAYAPCADEQTLRRLRPRSTVHPVRLWTLLGGIFGGFLAFAMTIWMSRDWPLVVGGKPIVSWPPFICVCFEMTVLYASFGCLIALCAYARIPHLTLPAAYRPEFMHDRFGLYISGSDSKFFRPFHPDHVYAVSNPPRARLTLVDHLEVTH